MTTDILTFNVLIEGYKIFLVLLIVRFFFS